MGLGAYLAAITEAEHYRSELQREQKLAGAATSSATSAAEIEEAERIYSTMAQYGIERAATTPIIEQLRKNPDMWVKFVMDFDLRVENPGCNRAWISAVCTKPKKKEKFSPKSIPPFNKLFFLLF